MGLVAQVEQPVRNYFANLLMEHGIQVQQSRRNWEFRCLSVFRNFRPSVRTNKGRTAQNLLFYFFYEVRCPLGPEPVSLSAERCSIESVPILILAPSASDEIAQVWMLDMISTRSGAIDQSPFSSW
jgi:hypothetical protein